jgi:hypothetical protein
MTSFLASTGSTRQLPQSQPRSRFLMHEFFVLFYLSIRMIYYEPTLNTEI